MESQGSSPRSGRQKPGSAASRPPVKVGLKQIAQKAGCSVAVASTVLNQSRSTIGVGPDMKATLKRLAMEMGYRPNFAAQSLVRRQSRTLGVYVAAAAASGLGHPYESSILQGVEQACQQQGYDLLVINMAGEAQPSVCLDRLMQHRADGLVLIRVDGPTSWVAELARTTDRLVAVDCVAPDASIDAVIFDNDQAVSLALEHLLTLGHRRIAFLGSCIAEPNLSAIHRQRAFVDQARRLGLTLDPSWIHDRGCCRIDALGQPLYCHAEGEAGIEHLLKIPAAQRPTAVLGYNDLVAFSAIRRLQGRGLNVPGAMSVVGIDHSDICHYSLPTITSVIHPLAEMGRLAADWLIQRASSSREMRQNRPLRRQTFPAALAAHDSTGPLSIRRRR